MNLARPLPLGGERTDQRHQHHRSGVGEQGRHLGGTPDILPPGLIAETEMSAPKIVAAQQIGWSTGSDESTLQLQRHLFDALPQNLSVGGITLWAVKRLRPQITEVPLKIVYLHGVGTNGDADGSWLTALSDSLTRTGASEIDEAQVIAPRYSALLGIAGSKVPHPKTTYTVKNDGEARRSFERRQAEVERNVRRFEDVRTFGFNRLGRVVEPVQSAFIEAAPIYLLAQVRNYLHNANTRAAVLQHILDALPTKGEIILIGHSLGSVIAIDLLDNLPPAIKVRRFITIGSPAGSPVLSKNSAQILKRFPYSRVDDWSNFLDPLDPVTAGKGLAALFPGAQDFTITGAGRHSAKHYLKHRAIATLIDQTLNPGSQIVPSRADLAIRLSKDQLASLAALEYAHLVAANIDDAEKQSRFEGAVAVLRDNYVDALREESPAQALPPELEALASGRLPTLPRVWDLADSVAMTVVLSNTNLVAPYEIAVGTASTTAIEGFMQRLGYPSGTAKKVRDAVESVNDHLAADKWAPSAAMRVAIAAAGVALLAAGPLGVAMAGAGGAAGAAAITSGLAAFGPGGMVGGLAMLTGLGGTGGMVAAAAATARRGSGSLMLDPTSLAIRVATAHALKNVGEPFDSHLWNDLAAAETELAADYNRASVFSDRKSEVVQRIDLARKTITGLQEYMLKHRLVPDALVPSLSDDEPGEAEEDSEVQNRFLSKTRQRLAR